MRYILQETPLKTNLWEMLSRDYQALEWKKNHAIAGAYYDLYCHRLNLAVITGNYNNDEDRSHKLSVAAHHCITVLEFNREDAGDFTEERARLVRHIAMIIEQKHQAKEHIWYILKERQYKSLAVKRDYKIGGVVFDFYCPRLKAVIVVNSSLRMLHDVKALKNTIVAYGLQYLGINEHYTVTDITVLLGMLDILIDRADESDSHNYATNGTISEATR